MSRHEGATQQFVRRCSRLLLERIACPRLYTKCARERIPVRVGCNPLHGPPSLNLAQHLGDAVCERWLHLIYTSSRHPRASQSSRSPAVRCARRMLSKIPRQARQAVDTALLRERRITGAWLRREPATGEKRCGLGIAIAKRKSRRTYRVRARDVK